MRCLVWFREDLRVHDNTALHHACRLAGDGVCAVYIITPLQWQAHDVSARRVDFLLRNLRFLSEALAKLHIPLLIKHVDSYLAIPKLLLQVAQRYQIDAVCYNQQYEVDESRRDLRVEKLLRQHGVTVAGYHDQLIIAPGEVLTKNGHYYTVYTPFKKAWLKVLAQQGVPRTLPVPKQQKLLTILPDSIPNEIAGFTGKFDSVLWSAGEVAAMQRLNAFIANKIFNYHQFRDFPALDATSRLSPYLTAGVLSIRQCFSAAILANQNSFTQGDEGVLCWINELIWREFYKHVLNGFPQVSMSRPFKLETENLVWENDSQFFAAWSDGRTGYPLVDAAMRQLNTLGWMHNRLRMLVAMFLVKDLLIDWRWGEKYFMQHLIDGDLAANNGGWQWTASSGTDAAPYFRIFNPISQSKKFDPEGIFIKQYCPELAELSGDELHDPRLLPPLLRKNINYPEPIVDHDKARLKALAFFKAK